MLQKSSRLLPWRVAGFLPLLILLTTGCADASQRIVEGPSDTTVRLHETVLLKCRVEEQVRKCKFASKNYFRTTILERRSAMGAQRLWARH